MLGREALAGLKARWGRGVRRRSEDEAALASRRRTESAKQLASALLAGRCTLLVFQSSRCSLCRRVEPAISRAAASSSSWLSLVRLDVEDEVWHPEQKHYEVSYVPCMVLLDGKGRARLRSVVPASRGVVLGSLEAMLREGRAKFAGRKGA